MAKKATKKKAPEFEAELDNLSGDAVNCVPLPVDWRELLGEDMEGWRSFEANTCDKCGGVVVLSAGQGGEDHKDLDYQVPEECPKCQGFWSKITIPADDDLDHEMAGLKCDDCGHVIVDPSECDGHVSQAEGPMMNYFYPVDIKSCEDAAKLLADSCLCVVEMRDGTTGLALTGGGMDLSWEICAAFIKIGFLPPVHFADLPSMGGKTLTKENRLIVAACLKSCEVAKRRISWTEERIANTVKYMRSSARKK